MKKFIYPIAFLFLSLILFSQVERYEVIVTNVEVSLRVLDGNRFVNDLTMDDFELYEDGKFQKIEALYLVKKTNIEREEAIKRFNPNLSRHYYLLFQIIDYNPKLDEAIDYLFNHVIQPEDTLTLWTPIKKYNLPSKAIKTIPKENISKEMQKIIRKDAKVGASSYRTLMKDLKRLVRSMSSAGGFGDESNVMSSIESESLYQSFSLEFLLPRYRETLEKMDDLRIIDEKMLIKFAEILKRQEGENIVFFFYQREYRPEISSSIVNRMISLYQDQPNILADLQDLFQFYHRDISLDVNKIRQAFADSSLLFNFIFMSNEPQNISGIYMREQSEDIFKTLSGAAIATGGIVDSSHNPASSFKNALDASQYYYLLYYSPAEYKKDGKFKEIKVRVKNKSYKVIHRLGYFAD